jgi:propanol-preferring alcohol dehydrogenase
MKVMRWNSLGGKLETATVPIPQPSHGEVRVSVHACGICHGDEASHYGVWGGKFPRVPGHEVAGVIDEVGPGVSQWKKGDRVGVGWFGGCCTSCQPCKSNDWVCCEKPGICGHSYDGGYAEYLVCPAIACAKMPDGLDFVDAAPLLCAGLTPYNALRNSGAKPGDVVAVVGMGGLGHMAVQFAAKMGFNTVAISRGTDKKELSLKLGAHVYLDSNAQNVGEELKKLGGAAVIMVTAPTPDCVDPLVPGLRSRGEIIIVSVIQKPVSVTTNNMLGKRASVKLWASGDSRDSEDTMNFAKLMGIKAMSEVVPLEKAQEAYESMLSNKARFRMVLKIKD